MRKNLRKMLNPDAGLAAGSDGKEPDDTKSLAWQRGWAEAQE